ncbi:hypothetical protein Glove_606g139 [Diversispora epigaea]|uniref:Zn(2)-C6 fungal-type domain-containing protein n=1 Tax=Diversispora epigaea TaxID=1348612 RepID=A0A397GA10_9GLOM|nr:hypothetical protein Glove_606g139 [Diversispora epigaea]
MTKPPKSPACTYCKAKKVKCVFGFGENPQCSECKRRRLTCEQPTVFRNIFIDNGTGTHHDTQRFFTFVEHHKPYGTKRPNKKKKK